MSLSKPTNTNTNPAVKFFQWSGDEGRIKYYDKQKGENVFLDLPFKFIKLDTLSTVTGYSDADNSGFWSNEVRSIKSEEFIVKTKNGIRKEGLWSDIGEGLKAQGAKFASSVYIAYINEDDKLELCNIKFYGSSITQWIEFLKISRDPGVVLTDATQAKKGKTVYYTPVFEPLNITDEQLEEAIELDKDLQIYLDSYFNYSNKYSDEKVKSASAGSDESIEYSGMDATTPNEDENDDVPF